MTETPSHHQPHWAMQLLQLLALFSMAILLSGLATNYVFHRIRLLAGDGVSCTRYLPDGGVERLYGATQCDRN
ncbi:MAG: hypothetical protein IGR80_08575 [Synechococcales cyanobacterium K44_A2020_017]|nr:hypothetical protein [Synechococcales cyanobacterium K32_A2020_035]MBF2094799.1 hypothetical protein [Synechococcales cyanobacterium K44_A2020_017]